MRQAVKYRLKNSDYGYFSQDLTSVTDDKALDHFSFHYMRFHMEKMKPISARSDVALHFPPSWFAPNQNRSAELIPCDGNIYTGNGLKSKTHPYLNRGEKNNQTMKMLPTKFCKTRKVESKQRLRELDTLKFPV